MPHEAGDIAAKLDALNHERRSIEADMQDSALATLDAFDPEDGFSLSLFNEDWHQGVIGILASRLKDKFHRPVIAFARSQTGELKGSGRSIAGLHLRDALDLVSKRQPHLILKFGGHAMAAGLSIREEHLHEFRLAFESVAQELLDADALVKTISTDGELEASEFSLNIARDLQQPGVGTRIPRTAVRRRFPRSDSARGRRETPQTETVFACRKFRRHPLLFRRTRPGQDPRGIQPERQ